MKAPGEEPSIMRHPLVSTLLWAWQKFNGVAPGEGKAGEQSAKSPGSPRNSPQSSGELGLMWQEEYGGHLDLYAEYFTELNKNQPAGGKTESQHSKENKDSGSGTPNYSPFATPSPGNWGWYIPITPPREGMFGNTNSPGPGSGRMSKPLKVVVAAPVSAPNSLLPPIQPAPAPTSSSSTSSSSSSS